MKESATSILVMGVSGSGKSHVGRLLAERLGARFVDADAHHSPASIAKMARGEPLNDDDRAAWLDTLGEFYADHRRRGESLVIGCSALKRRYRDRLRRDIPGLDILYLHGSREILLERMMLRQGHFFAGEHMLDSQLRDLEPPGEDEARRMDIRMSPEDIVERFVAVLDGTAIDKG